MRTGRIKLAIGVAGTVLAVGVLVVGCDPAVLPEGLSLDAAAPPTPTPAPPWGSPPPTTPTPTTPTVTPSATPTPRRTTPTHRPAPPPLPAGTLPAPAHVVVVLEENHSPAAIAAGAPYLAALAAGGAGFSNAYAERHPSEPNYLALFSGSTHGVSTDACPLDYHGTNLASQLIAAGRTFTGYAESMPSDGYTGCLSGEYARKHNPWVNFSNVPAGDNLRFSRFPQGNFDALPRVSFVVPNLCDDMHDCDVPTGDAWLKANLGAYATWAVTHNSLLIVTFDEAESGVPNRIPLIVYGDHVKPGVYTRYANHYTILRTLEDLFGLACLGESCGATPLTTIWR